VCVDVDI